MSCRHRSRAGPRAVILVSTQPNLTALCPVRAGSQRGGVGSQPFGTFDLLEAHIRLRPSSYVGSYRSDLRADGL